MIKYFTKIFLLLVVAVSMLSAQGLDDNNDAKKLYNDGIKLKNSGNFNGALTKFEEAIALVKDYRLYFQKGESLRKLKKFEDAIPAYGESIALNDGYFPSYFYTAGSYYALGQFQKAKEFYTKTKQLTKNKKVVAAADKNIDLIEEKMVRPIVDAGDALKTSRKFSQAIDKYNEALAYGENLRAMVGIIECNFELGKNNDAISVAEQVIAINNSKYNGAAYYYKGRAHKNLNDIESAKAAFQKGLRTTWKDNCKHEMDLLP